MSDIDVSITPRKLREDIDILIRKVQELEESQRTYASRLNEVSKLQMQQLQMQQGGWGPAPVLRSLERGFEHPGSIHREPCTGVVHSNLSAADLEVAPDPTAILKNLQTYGYRGSEVEKLNRSLQQSMDEVVEYRKKIKQLEEVIKAQTDLTPEIHQQQIEALNKKIKQLEDEREHLLTTEGNKLIAATHQIGVLTKQYNDALQMNKAWLSYAARMWEALFGPLPAGGFPHAEAILTEIKKLLKEREDGKERDQKLAIASSYMQDVGEAVFGPIGPEAYYDADEVLEKIKELTESSVKLSAYEKRWNTLLNFARGSDYLLFQQMEQLMESIPLSSQETKEDIGFIDKSGSSGPKIVVGEGYRSVLDGITVRDAPEGEVEKP